MEQSKINYHEIIEEVRNKGQIEKAIELKAIIEPIPADKFIARYYSDLNGNCCFIGHINRVISGSSFHHPNGFGARQLTAKFLIDKHKCKIDGADVNNFPTVSCYTEPEIKDRLMHLINDMIEAGY